MPAVAVTVIDRLKAVWSSRLVQVDDPTKLTDIVVTLVSGESVARLQRVQRATSDPGIQCNVAGDHEDVLHIEYGKTLSLLHFGSREHSNIQTYRCIHVSQMQVLHNLNIHQQF